MRNMYVSKIAMLGLLVFASSVSITAQENPECPGAPLPQLIIGETARVLPGDPNNVREIPSREGALTGTIPGGEVFQVLDGPVCADGFNWWQVEYGTLTGWTVDGTGAEYWLEPYEVPAIQNTDVPPTPTSEPVFAPAAQFVTPLEAVNVLAVGAQVRVINDDPYAGSISLTMRAEPGLNGAPIRQASEGDVLTIVDGAQEMDGLRWWQVETPGGTVGWVIDGQADRSRFNRTLLAVCPAEGDRHAFRLGDYIVTRAPDGGDPCVLDYIGSVPAWKTFSSTIFDFDNRLVISPDGQYLLYTDERSSDGRTFETLFRLRLDGSERRVLTQGVNVRYADWSPDGLRIAIATGQQVGIINAEGGGFRAVTEGFTTRTWVDWLPDGDTILYVQQNGSRDQLGTAVEYRLYAVNLREGNLREVMRTPLEVDLRDTALSPDGTQFWMDGLEYESVQTEAPRVYLGNPTGWTKILTIETGELADPADTRTEFVVWTPDSLAIVAVPYARQDSNTTSSLFLVPVNGDDPTEITLSGDELPSEFKFFRWETDEVFLAYLGYGFQVEPESWGLWAVNIATGEVERRW